MDRARKFFNGNRGNLGEDRGDSQAKSTARVSSFFHPRTASEIKRRVYYRIIIVAASILFFVWCLAEAGAYTAPGDRFTSFSMIVMMNVKSVGLVFYLNGFAIPPILSSFDVRAKVQQN